MSERYCWVNPADTTDIVGPTGRGGGTLVTPDGTVNAKRHDPAANIYLVTDDTTAPGPGERWSGQADYTFSGIVGNQAARVLEDRSPYITQISLDALRIEKQEELSSIVFNTRYSNCQTALHPTWVLRIEEDDRAWYSEVDSVLQSRTKRKAQQMEEYLQLPQPRPEYQAWVDAKPADEQAPSWWPRDIPVRAINPNTNRYASFDINESQHEQVVKDIGLHGYAIVDAAALVQADIDAAYGDGTGVPGGPEWQALLAVDPSDPLYGWPPVYRPEVAPTGNGR